MLKKVVVLSTCLSLLFLAGLAQADTMWISKGIDDDYYNYPVDIDPTVQVGSQIFTGASGLADAQGVFLGTTAVDWSDAYDTWRHANWLADDPAEPPLDPNTQWVGSSYYTEDPLTEDSWRVFRLQMDVDPGYSHGTLLLAIDNQVEVFLNGVSLINLPGDPPITSEQEDAAYKTLYEVHLDLNGGEVNELGFVLKNIGGSNSATANPTGLIFNVQANTPEPASLLLFGSAAGLLGYMRRRKNRVRS